jgi:hypothetical protein
MQNVLLPVVEHLVDAINAQNGAHHLNIERLQVDRAIQKVRQHLLFLPFKQRLEQRIVWLLLLLRREILFSFSHDYISIPSTSLHPHHEARFSRAEGETVLLVFMCSWSIYIQYTEAYKYTGCFGEKGRCALMSPN